MLTPDTAFPRDAEFLDYIRSFVDESRLSRAAVDRLFALARRGADAADEIERLRAALQWIVKHPRGGVIDTPEKMDRDEFIGIARTALKEDGDA